VYGAAEVTVVLGIGEPMRLAVPCWLLYSGEPNGQGFPGVPSPGHWAASPLSAYANSKTTNSSVGPSRNITAPTLPVGMAAAPGLATVVDGCPW
jgi:hypothetical protein